MEKIRMTIKADTTYETVELFKYLKDAFLTHYNIERAEVRYDKMRMNDENDPPEKWSLQLFFDRLQISVYGLTAGYGGTGPHDLKKILDYCGFKDTERVFEESNINFYI